MVGEDSQTDFYGKVSLSSAKVAESPISTVLEYIFF